MRSNSSTISCVASNGMTSSTLSIESLPNKLNPNHHPMTSPMTNTPPPMAQSYCSSLPPLSSSPKTIPFHPSQCIDIESPCSNPQSQCHSMPSPSTLDLYRHFDKDTLSIFKFHPFIVITNYNARHGETTNTLMF